MTATNPNVGSQLSWLGMNYNFKTPFNFSNYSNIAVLGMGSDVLSYRLFRVVTMQILFLILHYEFSGMHTRCSILMPSSQLSFWKTIHSYEDILFDYFFLSKLKYQPNYD